MDLPPRDVLQARIERLDLAVVRRRLMNEHGWDSAAATAAEDQYRRFERSGHEARARFPPLRKVRPSWCTFTPPAATPERG